MADPFTVKPVYNALSQYIRNRADIGAGRAMRDGALEPSNPFERKAARPPRRWFVLLSLLAAMVLGFFVYFNNHESKFATGSFSSGLSSCSAWVGWRGCISISQRTKAFTWDSRAGSCSVALWGF